MGAYYSGTIEIVNKYDKEKVNYYSFCPLDSKNGSKLMEHSYIGNNYVESVLQLLKQEPRRLMWVCDYATASDVHEKWLWDNTIETPYPICTKGNRYIYNIDREVFIDIKKLKKLYIKAGTTEFMIHPIPILCNSNFESQGGGYFHCEDNRRNTWAGDRIMVSEKQICEYCEFTDITRDCLFFE
jgi:hypothetical protein